MSSDPTSSRIPVPKRTTSFVSRAGALPAAIPSHRMRHTSSTRSRRGRGDRRSRTAVRVKKEWIIGALMGCALIFTVVVLWVLGRTRPEQRLPAAAVADRSDDAVPLEKWHGPVPAVVAERFIEAKTHEERLDLVRNPEEVGPVMEAFFKTGPGAKEEIVGMHPVASAASGDLLFESYAVSVTDSPARLLNVSVDPQGAKVDFECYARFGTVAWPDLLSGKTPVANEVRVILQPGGYFTHGFSDEKKWLHFKATSPDLADSLELYLDRTNPSASELKESGTSMFRATLSLRAVNGSEKHRQFEITTVKALGWVEPG